MTEFKAEETQQELFQEFSGQMQPRRERFPSLAKSQKPILVSTSLEQIILAVIVVILTGCFVFFLGVIRGKGFTASPAKETAAAPRTAMAVPVQKTVVTVQPPAVSPQAAPMPAADIKKPYTIQVVTYKKREPAEQEAAMLRRKGFYAVVIPGQGYFPVCAGQYENKESAQKDLNFFRSRYKTNCFLRRRS
jgi:septal ring-binding cell division protein DamX